MKQINNIEYFQDHTATSTSSSTKMLAWQAWKIGPGKSYCWTDMVQVVRKISPLKVLLSSNESTPWVTECSETYGNKNILNSK